MTSVRGSGAGRVASRSEGAPLLAREPAGIDVEGVTGWFAEHIPQARAPLTFELIAGGRSNLTYQVTDREGRRFALRRPPVSHVLPTAHDMAREHRLISALGPTPVPVPKALGLCTDEAVSGAGFYVMEFVEGHVVRSAKEAEGLFDMATRGRIGENMAGTLAALHALDVEEIGLGDLSRHEGYIERQLRRWSGQFRQMAVAGVDDGGLVEVVGKRLAEKVPAAQGTCVVHGDYRFDNVVFGDQGTIRAILDWEICTLGDPLADLGVFVDYWAEPGDPVTALSAAPTTAPGFASRAELVAAYGRASGRDVSGIGYYRAFGYWKLACILQGVYARYQGGAGAGDPSSVEQFPGHIRKLAEMAGAMLDGRGLA